MSAQKGKEIVIVGAGVAGCSIAFHLAKRGMTSLIIERESIAATEHLGRRGQSGRILYVG